MTYEVTKHVGKATSGICLVLREFVGSRQNVETVLLPPLMGFNPVPCLVEVPLAHNRFSDGSAHNQRFCTELYRMIEPSTDE